MIALVTDPEYLKTLDVLYVEDDELTRRHLSQFLRRRVGSLTTAEDGRAGLEAFRAQRPDIVITDILMPHMDGLDMVQEMRKTAPTMPVIVTTAFEQTEYLLRSIDLGVDKYVTKPIDTVRLENAMLRLAHHLQSEVIARQVSELGRQSQKLESLGAMAGGMAHDFNNLLQIIMGNVECALSCAMPESNLLKHLERAHAGCEKARTLSRLLLSLASGKPPFDTTDSLAPLIRESVGEVLHGTRVVLDWDLPTTLPATVFNSGQMRMVFAQLAANARNAMPEGGTLQISADRCTVAGTNALALPDGEYLRIQFSDTGMGIARENLPRIFDPYWSTQPLGPQKGLGLGLTLCYTVIKRHAGLIVANSEPGCGATFDIYLPVKV